MSDDWRLRVGMLDDGAAKALTERLEAEQLGEDLQKTFGDRLIVSGDGADVLVYAGERAQAEAAADAIRALAGEHHWEVELELKRWHPTAEEWEDPDKPLPASDEELAAEHARLVARERDDTAERGYAEYEVKVHCSSHRDTVKLASRLHDEGLPIVRRWKYILVGASDEDAANALAERLRAEAPTGATVTAEVSQRAAWD
ncbi:MAG: hypothetical protein JO304_04890, partial [Solirubrobacterales bacterium]|nr:hypothetical protein [Solirubrobacterales bacterium]